MRARATIVTGSSVIVREGQLSSAWSNSSNSTPVLPRAKTLKFTPLGYTVAPSGKLLPGETMVFIRRDLGSLFYRRGAEIRCSRFFLKSPFFLDCMRVTVSAMLPNLPQLAERLHYFPLKRVRCALMEGHCSTSKNSCINRGVARQRL